MKSQTTHLNRVYSDVISALQYFKDEKANFKISSTGYTTQIQEHNSNFKYFFSVGRPKRAVFGIYKRIEKDVKNCNIVIDEISPYDIDYYNVNTYFRRKRGIENIINIDIRSAYLTVLKNTGFITDETFQKAQKVSKFDRLKAVGMLATQKTVLNYANGIQSGVETVVNKEYRNVFLYCCHKIDRILSYICQLAGSEFLFYWVDGIYFSENFNTKPVKEFLKKENFEFSEEILKNCRIEKTKDMLLFSYSTDTKKKDFKIPIDNGERARLRQYLKSEYSNPLLTRNEFN